MSTPRARALVALAKAATVADVEAVGEAELAGTPAGPVPPPEDDGPAVEAAVAVLALWLASSAAISAANLPADLLGTLGSLGLSRRAVRAAVTMALKVPMTGRTRAGAPLPRAGQNARRRVAADEPLYRARYILNAAKRLTDAGKRRKFKLALKAERRYLSQHRAAGRARRAAAARYDAAAARSRTGLMRWETRRDNRVTPDCAALDGAVFHRDAPPAIPGAQHVACRCRAVPI